MKVPVLMGPYEFWDLASGEKRRIKVSGWEAGDVTIQPRDGIQLAPKVVPALRLHLWPGFKATVPNYWDITSQLLMATLKPMLQSGKLADKTLEITKIGVAPRARFTLAVLP